MTDSPSVLAAALALSDAANPMHGLFADLAGLTDREDRAAYAERNLVVSEYQGNYGFAGLVICLEGSPPKGTLIVPKGAIEHNAGSIVYVSPSGMRMRRFWCWMNRRNYAPIVAYARAWLAANEAAKARGEGLDERPDA